MVGINQNLVVNILLVLFLNAKKTKSKEGYMVFCVILKIGIGVTRRVYWYAMILKMNMKHMKTISKRSRKYELC